MTGQTPPPSFASFETGQKILSDDFIVGAVTNTLEYAPGERAYMVKSYLDQIPADASDEAFAANESAVAKHRSELANFIGSNLKVVGSGIPSDVRDHIKAAKASYLTKLDTDQPTVANWMHGWRTGGRPKMPQSEYGFYGFNLSVGGKRLDLTEPSDNYANLRSTVVVQRQVAGQFVQWNSPSYLLARVKGEEVPMKRRIYLNPRIESSVSVFQQVVSAAAEKGLKVQGKIFDRSAEAITPHTPGKTRVVRGDGIVLYAPEAEADELLRITEEVYKANHDAFKGRRTSRIPMTIGEGVAVGSEVSEEGESLTSNRASVIESAVQQTRDKLGIGIPSEKDGPLTGEKRERAIKVFRDSWNGIASAAGIDPKNIAFNKH